MRMNSQTRLSNYPSDKFEYDKPFDEMTTEEKLECTQQFMLKLAEFLFATKNTIQSVMISEVFDKVIDGTEHRVIKHKNFNRYFL